MPTLFWAKALVLALAAATSLPAAPDAAFVQAEAAGPGRTRLSFATQPRAVLTVTRDRRVPPAAPPEAVQLVGRVGDTVVLVVDRYRSRLNLGQGQCGAGQEQFLRVVRLRPLPAKETFRLKLDSCWDSIERDSEFGQDGLSWSPDDARLQLRWLFGPTRHLEAEARTLHITPDGQVKDIKPA